MEQTGIAKKLFRGDVAVWIIYMLLCGFSIIEVFSATSTLAYRYSNIWIPITRHATFLLVGFLLILGLVHIHHKYFSLGILLMPLSIILLFITFIWGIDQNDANRRLDLFGTPFQPSEIAKLASIIFVAYYLSTKEKYYYLYILVGVGAVCGLIFPSNLSTSLILGTVCFCMLFIGQVPWQRLLRLVLVLTILGTVFIMLLAVVPTDTVGNYLPRAITWQKRVHSFTQNVKKPDPNSSNNTTIQTNSDDYQVIHAKIAIARGGIIGKGPGQSIQRDFLPQAYDDFIYAIIIEELGVIGGIVVLLLYLFLAIRGGIIANQCNNVFAKYLVFGCSIIILIQALVNMAVAVHFGPVTGQPLPLISQGGTSILVTSIYIGIILSVSSFNAKVEAAKLIPDSTAPDDSLTIDDSSENEADIEA
jgi:cell division protein FtsW